jgi:hypothetical protein
MNQQLRGGLRRMADLIDPEHVAAAERLQTEVWAFKPAARVPVILHRLAPPDWPLYPFDVAFANPEKMLWNQLCEARIGAELRDDRLLNVRVHYGLAAVPSLFGAPVRPQPATIWVEPCHDARAIRTLVDRGMPELTTGLGRCILETEGFFRATLHDFGLDPFVHMFQADNQGPFDCAYLLWGEEIYLAMHDDPDLVHALLDLITETTIAFVQRQKEVLGEPRDQMYHWWYRVPAGVRAVDDVTINLSRQMYAEFCRPYNERLFAAFGGGYIHYCGHGLHAQDLRVTTQGLRGIEMGAEEAWHNPAYTLEAIWRAASARRVAICWAGPGLPAARPAGLDTGLLYGFWEDGLSWEAAPARLAAARAFWENKPEV